MDIPLSLEPNLLPPATSINLVQCHGTHQEEGQSHWEAEGRENQKRRGKMEEVWIG